MNITVDNSDLTRVASLLLSFFIGAGDPVAADKLSNLAHVVELVIHRHTDVCLEDYTFGFAGQLLA